MRVGDIIVVSGKSFISKTIQKVVGSKWTHVALYVGGDYILEIDWNTKATVTRNMYPISDLEYVVLRSKAGLTKDQRDGIISSAIAHHQKGTKYDWILLATLWLKSMLPNNKLLGKLNGKNTFVCTELVDEVLKKVGVDLFPDKGGDIYPHDYLSCDQLKNMNLRHVLPMNR